TTAEEPPEIQVEKVSTAEEMLNAVLSELSSADVVIMNAAVSDYRPKEVASGKMKKRDMLTLELEKTPDILKTVGERKGDRFVVGFALESEDLLQGGREKLKEKGADMIVANPLDVMGAKHHRGYLITDEKVEEFEFEDKLASAFWIMDRIAQLTSPQRSQDP
ncbi:MAG TPA: phosphopantothenoylcysteine decarboxylase, partial [Aquificaceae bacterium]|nr:phosphopantothenoylcysteine decarboxylase [Aquificaceae bacterium]